MKTVTNIACDSNRIKTEVEQKSKQTRTMCAHKSEGKTEGRDKYIKEKLQDITAKNKERKRNMKVDF